VATAKAGSEGPCINMRSFYNCIVALCIRHQSVVT